MDAGAGDSTPSPAPDLIPAETKNRPRTHITIGTANGGTSTRLPGFEEYAPLCESNPLIASTERLHIRRAL
jgi:hypothetical protein